MLVTWYPSTYQFVIYWTATNYSTIVLSTACAHNVDVVFVLDTSGNISPGEFRLMKEFAIEIANKLSIGTHKSRVAAVTYSSRAHLGFTLDMFSSARDVRNALSSLLYEYGNSNAVAALELVRSKIFNYKTGDRPDVKNFGNVNSWHLKNFLNFLLIYVENILKRFLNICFSFPFHNLTKWKFHDKLYHYWIYSFCL